MQFSKAADAAVTKMLSDLEVSTPSQGLKDRAHAQGAECHQEASQQLEKSVTLTKDTLNDKQKEISRSISMGVQAHLYSGYQEALEERSTGSVKRQKALFHNFVNEERSDMFNGGAKTIMDSLSNAATSVGLTLKMGLLELAMKVR